MVGVLVVIGTISLSRYFLGSMLPQYMLCVFCMYVCSYTYHQIQVKCDHCHYIFECSQSAASDSHRPIFTRVSCHIIAHCTDPPCDQISRNIKVNRNCHHLQQNAAIRVLMTAPIFFWQNSEMFLKKTIFLARKLTKLKHSLEISQNFMRKSLKSVTKIFEMVLILTGD